VQRANLAAVLMSTTKELVPNVLSRKLRMKFILTFDWTPDAEERAEGIARFQKTGGFPPKGVRLLGRWTRADLSGGFALLESDDATKLLRGDFPVRRRGRIRAQ
jgi:hypothetical protein